MIRESGLSFRKGATLRALAERFVDGRLSDQAFARMSDEDVEATLAAIPGSSCRVTSGFAARSSGRTDSTTSRPKTNWRSWLNAGDRIGASR